MSNLEEQVCGVIAEQLDVDRSGITRESHLVNDLGADSLDAVELVMALEEQFGVEISDDEAQKILTVSDAIDFIKAKLD